MYYSYIAGVTIQATVTFADFAYIVDTTVTSEHTICILSYSNNVNTTNIFAINTNITKGYY